jgi:DNA polymerase
VSRGGASTLAAVARQARGLLGNVQQSRWPGFAPVAKTAPGSADAPTPAPAPAQAPMQARTQAPGPAAAARRAPEAPRAPAARAVPATPPVPVAPRPQEAPAWSSLEEVAGVVASCTKCGLHATRHSTVPGEGNPRARLMFVGEAPGEEEDAKGRPFVGAAGRLLDKMIAGMGLARSDVFIANVLKCRPPGNRDPLGPEVTACLPYLRAQIALVRPEVVCALGRHAAHALLGGNESLGRMRTRFHDFGGTPLLVTYHPSYLLRTPEDKGKAWKDLQMIMQRLALPLPAQRPAPEEPR